MMDCRSVEKVLSLHVDGELDPRTRLAVEVHLRRCAACQNIFQKMGSIRSCLGARRVSAPDDFSISLHGRLRELETTTRIASQKQGSNLRRALVVAAVLVLLMATGVVTLLLTSRQTANSGPTLAQQQYVVEQPGTVPPPASPVLTPETGALALSTQDPFSLEAPLPPADLLTENTERRPWIHVSY